MLTAKESLDYVLRDLGNPQGGYYSAEDADSEGEEGKFYLWTAEEIQQALPAQEASLAIKLFNVLPEGNFSEPSKGRSGKNILHISKPIDQLAQESNLTIEQLIVELGKITTALFKARETRVHPSKDDKVLVDWNGLMIAALARAGQVFGEEKYLQEAKKSADFLLREMKTDNGRLLHRYAKGEKAIDGFLDDYAFFVFGLIELYEVCFDEYYLKASVDLSKIMIDEFWDKQVKGFFFTKADSDEAVPRMKQTYDGAAPSGNSVALLNLLRLSRLGEGSFEKYAAELLEAFSQEIKTRSIAHTFMLTGLDFALGPAFNVVLVGDLSEKDTLEMLKALRKKYLPNLTVTLHKPEQIARGVGYEKIDGKATAYVCRDKTCMPPTNSFEKMLELLEL